MVCPAGERRDWLTPVRAGEFCSHCERTVHDLSRLDAAQAEAVLEQRDAQGRTPCVAVKTNRRGEVLLRNGVAAMALAAITACAPWGDATWDDPLDDEPMDVCLAAHARDPDDLPPMCEGLLPPDVEHGSVGVVAGGVPGGSISCEGLVGAEVEMTRGAVAEVVPQTPPEDTAALGRVQGVVTDAGSGSPASGALVTARSLDQPDRQTMTNAKGQYSFSDLPPSEYAITVSWGHGDVSKIVELPPGAHFQANFRINGDERILMGAVVEPRRHQRARTRAQKRTERRERRAAKERTG